MSNWSRHDVAGHKCTERSCPYGMDDIGVAGEGVREGCCIRASA